MGKWMPSTAAILASFQLLLTSAIAGAVETDPFSSLQILNLDQRIERIVHDGKHSPLIRGQSEVIRHPEYSALELLADQLETKIEWVDSVAQSVLKLPFERDRMKIHPGDHFEGWFEEYTHPNIIFLDRNTDLSTLVHELRHAVDLGTYGTRLGDSLDVALQQSKAEARNFRKRLDEMLPSLRIEKLRKMSIDYIEVASEILAWNDDRNLASAFHNLENARRAQLKIKSYRTKFRKLYQSLKSDPLSKDEPFIEGLMAAMRKKDKI